MVAPYRAAMSAKHGQMLKEIAQIRKQGTLKIAIETIIEEAHALIEKDYRKVK